MFISCCGNYCVGLPLREFLDNLMQCRRYIDAGNLNLAQSREQPMGAHFDPNIELWAFEADALPLKLGPKCKWPVPVGGPQLMAIHSLRAQARRRSVAPNLAICAQAIRGCFLFFAMVKGRMASRPVDDGVI